MKNHKETLKKDTPHDKSSNYEDGILETEKVWTKEELDKESELWLKKAKKEAAIWEKAFNCNKLIKSRKTSFIEFLLSIIAPIAILTILLLLGQFY